MFQFMTSSRIIFGEGALHNSLSILNQFGYSVLLVTGRETSRSDSIKSYLAQQSMRYEHIQVCGEPNIARVEEMAVLARRFGPDMVVAIGGGSVIDMGKALAALVTNTGDLYDYVEVVGRSVPLKTEPLPMIAIPTTASTGSEVTKVAVLRANQDKVKVCLRSPMLLPDVAIVDPTLTYGMDTESSGRGAMDAFTHLMEAYVCGEPNPLTDMICEEGLRRIGRSMLMACLHDDKSARADVSFAAMLGGMATANAKLGAAHGLASALGGKLSAPHSLISAHLAPYVMLENIRAARFMGRNELLTRYRRLAQLVTGNEQAKIEEGVAWVQNMLVRLEIPPLSGFGLCDTSFELVARDALKSTAIQGNPLPLTEERLVEVLNRACDLRCEITQHRQDDLSEMY